MFQMSKDGTWHAKVQGQDPQMRTVIDMSFDYGNSLFIGLEIMTGKVDHDETLQNAASHRCRHCFL